MKYELPPLSSKEGLSFEHFPTRMQCFIFRNWEMIEPETLGKVLGCDEKTVLALAGDMGLPVPPQTDPDWLTKGYITVIRANWHLCTCEQIAALLGWSVDKLAFILKEDDFLSVKLGFDKPKAEPVTYAPLTEEQRKETARLCKVVREVRAKMPDEPAKPFDFRPRFAAAVQDHPAVMAERFEERILYSYCALYGDTFADRTLLDESFPDELLEAYRSLGISGVWTQAVLYTLVPFPFDTAYSEGYERRLKGVRYLTEKLKKYGLKLFLYLNEPRSMPESFFAAHPELRGHTTEDGSTCLCVSHPAVADYLYDSAKKLCTEAPDLGGFITITVSENLTNCYSHSVPDTCRCPRCGNRTPAEVVASVNERLYAGAVSVSPQIRLLAWNWGWESRQPDMNAQTAALLPAGVSLMCVSEEGVKKNVGGIETAVVDYSISVEGPGDYARKVWNIARQTGHGGYAKLQLGCTWEMAAVPCLPALEKIRRHLTAIASEPDVDGIMLGWTLGGFPSPTMAMARCFYERDRVPTAEEVYKTVFPEADPVALQQAFGQLSDAFDEFPFHLFVAYYAPQHFGPANLLYDRPTGYNATMVGNPYDDLNGWRGIYPEEVFIGQLKKLYEGWNEGVQSLEKICADGVGRELTDVLRWARVCGCHFESMYDQSVFILRRDREQVIDTALIRREEALAEQMIGFVSADPTVGYESSNHYFFTVNTLVEKILNCRRLLERYE